MPGTHRLSSHMCPSAFILGHVAQHVECAIEDIVNFGKIWILCVFVSLITCFLFLLLIFAFLIYCNFIFF